MSLDLDEELLKKWPDFCTFALETMKSPGHEEEGDSSSLDKNSLFLNLMHNERLEIYEECGFDSKVSEKLDELVKKTEHFCLRNVINLYESFKQKMLVKHMASCTVNIKRFDEFLNIDNKKGPRKGKGTQARAESSPRTPNGKEREIAKGKRKSTSDTDRKDQEHGRGKHNTSLSSVDSETEQELASPSTQELGRGKRKKIVKQKFEFSKDSPFTYKAKQATTPRTMLNSNKKAGQSEPRKKTSETTKSTPTRAMSNAKRKAERSSLSAFWKSKINYAKTSETGSGNEDPNVPKENPRNDVVDLEMSVDKEADPTIPADFSDHAACNTSVNNVKTEGGMQEESSGKCSEKANELELKKDGNIKTAEDGCSHGEKDLAADTVDGALVENEPTGDVTPRKGRGPQKCPKKLPWNKVPMVCSRCNTRFAAYSTLRRHWTRMHSVNHKFNFSNPPKLLLCTVCGDKFSLPQVYLKHYRAHGTNSSLDPKNSAAVAAGLDVKSENTENGGGGPNGSLETNGDDSKKGENDQLAAVKNESQKDGVEQEGLGTADSEKDNETTAEEGEMDEPGVARKKFSANVKSRRGRGPQKRPKKFPWSLVPIVCSMCKTRYSTYSTLRRHWTKMHSNNKEFDRQNPPKLMLCTVCDDTFSWPRQFLRHYREHAAGEELAQDRFRPVKFIGERTDFPCDKLVPITCSICKKGINGEGVIYSHWKKEHRTEEDEKPPPLFYCDKCEQAFDAPRKFKLHYRMHTGAKPHECEMCQKTFRTFSDLTAHMLSHNQSKEFKCEVCGKCFIAQKILNRHMKGHLFPCVCDICGKSYPSKYSLSLHTKIHTGEKPHKCEFCGVAFIQAGSLKLHRRLHLGDKPHVCETCGMRFNSMSHLRTHKRVHTGEKPYKCDKCNYAAASSSRLKDHMTVHKDEKPHVCKVPGCGRRYKRLSHLIFHHSKHAGIKPYVCRTCGMSFKLSSALSLHKRQDACALRKDGDAIEIKPDWTVEEQPKEDMMDYSLIVAKSEDAVDKPEEEIKEEHQTVYIYHDVREDLQDVGDGTQQVIGLDGASHAEFTLEGQDNFEQQIVIQIVREPGQEDEDIVLSKEELERIVHLSQQM
ncbi:hypothetical protein EGW08_012182 [Elysia chlorotica]|uniref:C2H2-type domain-containing protein n=1 Tax=Elysia chlorotica TaxID=188477 RepID=A0A3S1BC43_ELYCH|nr:hypothetical protein EGW08_012182 [Elysia chlorotica]